MSQSFAPVIFGCSGLSLTAEETSLFADLRPAGFILFARNIADPAQVRALTTELRAASPGALVLIDQEGGRVARLRPPHWRAAPPGRVYGDIYRADPAAARRAAWLNSRLFALELADLGIDTDCLPVLDVPQPGAHEIIGDRAYAADPAVIAEIGRAACDGLLAGGVLPVIKHIPGHGRAGADSHLALPVVEASLADLRMTDFAPFRALAGMPLAMTAHVTYAAIDAERCATLSPTVIALIRDEIGFQGALMSDDLNMRALSGSLSARASASLDAGCDLALHCSGVLDEMREIANVLPPMRRDSGQRLDSARARVGRVEPAGKGDFFAELGALLAPAWNQD